MATKKIRLLIVDDHTVTRAGVAAIVSTEPDMDVVGQAASAEEALQKLSVLNPHVVIMDLCLPGMSGLEATREIKKQFPTVDILVLTIKKDPEYFFAALEAGASGYLLKETETKEILAAIRAVSHGDAYFPPYMAKLLLKGYKEKDRWRLLTQRENEVLQLAAQGKSNREIAQQLSLSAKTVEKHRAKLMEKLGLFTRMDLLRYALEQGVIRQNPSP